MTTNFENLKREISARIKPTPQPEENLLAEFLSDHTLTERVNHDDILAFLESFVCDHHQA